MVFNYFIPTKSPRIFQNLKIIQNNENTCFPWDSWTLVDQDEVRMSLSGPKRIAI